MEYTRKDFVRTGALKRYLNDNQETIYSLSQKTAVSPKTLDNWVRRGSCPKQFLNQLGIKQRTIEPKEEKQITGGSFYACYVGKENQSAFLSFCKALKINAKFVI